MLSSGYDHVMTEEAAFQPRALARYGRWVANRYTMPERVEASVPRQTTLLVSTSV